MKHLEVNPIGKITTTGESFFIELTPKYIPALQGLEGFSHLAVLWWFSDFDSDEARQVLEAPKPYKKSPDVLGIFATRSPIRPNPIALSTAEIISIDHDTGRIQLAYIDANDQTPLLDIKPYTPSIDRVENPKVPDWCCHWPGNIETSGDFPWEEEFNF